MFNIPLTGYPDFNISERRKDRSVAALGSDIDINSLSPAERLEIRELVIYMSLLDRFCDWAFHHSSKKEALNKFADVLLAETPLERSNAATWLLTHATDEGFRCLVDEQAIENFFITFRDNVPLLGGMKVVISNEMYNFLAQSHPSASFTNLTHNNPEKAARMLGELAQLPHESTNHILGSIAIFAQNYPEPTARIFSALVRTQADEATSLLNRLSQLSPDDAANIFICLMQGYSGDAALAFITLAQENIHNAAEVLVLLHQTSRESASEILAYLARGNAGYMARVMKELDPAVMQEVLVSLAEVSIQAVAGILPSLSSDTISNVLITMERTAPQEVARVLSSLAQESPQDAVRIFAMLAQVSSESATRVISVLSNHPSDDATILVAALVQSRLDLLTAQILVPMVQANPNDVVRTLNALARVRPELATQALNALVLGDPQTESAIITALQNGRDEDSAFIFSILAQLRPVSAAQVLTSPTRDATTMFTIMLSSRPESAASLLQAVTEDRVRPEIATRMLTALAQVPPESAVQALLVMNNNLSGLLQRFPSATVQVLNNMNPAYRTLGTVHPDIAGNIIAQLHLHHIDAANPIMAAIVQSLNGNTGLGASNDAMMSKNMVIANNQRRPDYPGSDIELLDINLMKRISTDMFLSEYAESPLSLENGLVSMTINNDLITTLKRDGNYPDEMFTRLGIKNGDVILVEKLNNDDKKTITDIFSEYVSDFADRFEIGQVQAPLFSPHVITPENTNKINELYIALNDKYQSIPKTDIQVIVRNNLNGNYEPIIGKNISVERAENHRVNRFNAQPPLPDGGFAIHNSMYDRNLFLQLLEAIRESNEDKFINAMSKMMAGFPDNLSEARNGFKESFTTLFVTGKLPSNGLRDLYCHFIMRCGQIH